MGQFNQAGIDPKMRLVEFPVTEDAVVLPGASRQNRSRNTS
jgi:hypothetical protein